MKIALFVISGDKEHFVNFINSKYSEAEIRVIRYSSDVSVTEWIKKIRNLKCDAFFFCCDDFKSRKKRLVKIFSLFIKAKEKYLVDKYNKPFKCTLQNTLLESVPSLIIQSALCFLVLGFAYWFCFFMSRIPRHRRLEFHNRRRIAYLRTNLWPYLKVGGSVTHISGFTSGILKIGYKLFFISSDLLENVNKDASPIFVVKPYFFDVSTKFSEILYNLFFIIKGLRILKAIKPDFLYQRYSRLNFSGVVLAKLMKIPLFLEYNSSKVFWEKYSGRISLLFELIRSVETLNLKHADVIVVVSNAQKRKLLKEGIEPNRILVNPNCVDSEMFHPSTDPLDIRDRYRLRDKTVVGWVGIFSPWHGVDLLASTIPYVAKRNKNIHFVLIGEGQTRDEIERAIEEENLNTFVTFTGMVPHYEVPKYLAACDILVLSNTPFRDRSEFFGSPIKLFEYMAMRKGIVASNLGQIGEILRHNDNAYLVKPGDRRELVRGILELAKDNVLRNRLGRKARKDVVAKYTWKQNAKRVIDAYEEISHCMHA
jgi:glycosyltransferase involved in cell wall biosynthesis